MYKTINLEKFFNNTGVTSSDSISEGELSLAGSSLPLAGPFLEEEFYFEGVPYKLKKSGRKDNIALENQEIIINLAKVKKIHFVGNSFSGSYFDDIFFKFEAEIIKERICLTDFLLEEPSFENKKIYQFNHLHSIRPLHFKGSLWLHTIEFNNPTKIDIIQFDDNPFMHIFAITVEEEV